MPKTHHPPSQPSHYGLIAVGLVSAALLTALPGCAEGIVLNEPQSFNKVHTDEVFEVPTPEPSPTPEPTTRIEKLQVRIIDYRDKANEKVAAYTGLAWPLVIGLVLLIGFYQLMRMIVELTTSSPPLA